MTTTRLHRRWTAEKFKSVTGAPPEYDDLERVNCRRAGELGHQTCGVCAHGMPMFGCSECLNLPTVEIGEPEEQA